MKKLFTFLTLLVAIVTGAQAETYTLGFADETVNSCNGSYAAGTATFTCGTDVFTVTNTNDDPSKVKTNSNANYTGSDKVKRYGVKYSQNVVFTVNIPTGVAIKSVTFSGWANHDSNSTKIIKINGEDVSGATGNSFGARGAYDSWTYEFATAQTGSFTFENKGAEGVFNINLATESAPATAPTITTQPQGATYVIGTEDYPSMSVEATASAGELKYQWHIIVSETDVTIPGAEASTLSLATYASSPAFAPYLSQEGAYSIYCNVADDNDNVDSDMATLTVTATAPVTPADPTFDKEDGATMKAGDVITITSSAGSTIYYRWSGKSGQTWTPEAFKDGRTPNDSPCTTTTSTKGDRYVYAMAEINGNYSNITCIKVTVSENPVKGQLDKTSDAVDQNAEAPAVPVFTLVDADGNPSPASMGAEGSTKDIFVNYVVTGTEGIINLNSDATAIESISTATAGTATATITIKKNKDAYPIIDGESGIYTYTITVSEGSGPTPPAAGPTITTQPQDATYVIDSEDYPSMSVEAVASAGELKYQWHIIVSETDVTIPGAEASTLSLATYASSPAFAPYLSQEGAYSIYCNVADDNGNVNSDMAVLTIEAAPDLDPQIDVTGDMTWDWSTFSTVSSATVELTNSTTPAKDEEFVLSNVVNYGLLDNVSPEFQAIKAFCQYPVRDGKYFQGSEIKFNTTVSGKVKATFASTGSSKDTHNRDILINGEVAGNANKTTTFAESSEIEVAAGEVIVMGVLHGEGAQGTPQYLRISKIVFTADATGINGVAESETEAPANVKIIKNGQLYIGKYNVAGQLVK